MQTLTPPAPVEDHPAAHRRPGALEIVSAVLLLATVALHVAAMFPSYFTQGGALVSTADEAAEYAVLAAAWALALGIGLTGPHRTPIAAGLAVGIALTELGFRVYDLGEVFKYGTSVGGTGLWLMTAAWVAGAAAAAAACVAARARHRTTGTPTPAPPEPAPVEPTAVDWAAPVAAGPVGSGFAEELSVAEERSVAADGATPPDDSTLTVPAPEPTRTDYRPGPALQDSAHAEADDDPHERWAWTVLVAALAAATAGAFLPSWDRYSATRPSTGERVSTTLGNAFTGPWQQMVGNILVAVVLLVIPIVAVRMRHKAAAAAAVCGSLLVLTTQLLSAVVSVSEPVPPATFGLSPSQVQSLGVVLSLRLTSWFTVDTLAAYALFAAVMVWATLQLQAAPTGYPLHSPDGPRSDPFARSSAIPPSS